MGRMAKNIQAIGRSGYWVTKAGGDLYSLAAAVYGSAAEWATIARANGLTDPVLGGLATVLVPPVSGNTAGVLTDLRPAPAGAANVAPFLDADTSVAGMMDGSDPDDSIFFTVV